MREFTRCPHELNCVYDNHSLKKLVFIVFIQVNFDLGSNDNLGLMIRGGIEYGLGIFITGVEPQSAAHRHGLRVRRTNYFSIDKVYVT